MATQLHALERKIGATARNASEAYMKYGECVPELASRFGAKNALARWALPSLRKCGA